MDTASCCCQWLLWTTLLLLLHHYQEVSGSLRACPQGQLIHTHTGSHSITCCYPTRCGVGEEVKLCGTNGTQDTCLRCERPQNQSVRTSSYTLERCKDWPLNWECKSVDNPEKPRNMMDELTKRCMCNIEQGMRFDPPELQLPGVPMDSYCQRRNDSCQPGFEPMVDGGCQPCQKNYFKSVDGHSLCEPKTNCTLLGLKRISFSEDAKADNNCSQPEPIITKPSIPQKPYSTATMIRATTEVSRQSSTSTSSKSWIDKGVFMGTSLGPAVRQTEDKILWPIIGSVLVFVAVLVCVGVAIFCYRRRRRLLVCVYAAAKDCADAEGNHGQGSVYEQINSRVKRSTANGSTSSQNLIRGDKNMGNGINGGVPSGIEDLPNGHVHASIPQGHLNQAEHERNDAQQYTNPHHYRSGMPPRPGILRTDNRRVTFSHRQPNWPDLTLNLGQNTLQAHVDNFEANQELGESDCLLISEYQQGTGAHQMANLTGSGSSSPALLQDGMSPMQILALNGCRDTNFVKNGPFLPPLRPHRQAVPADGVTFTRSVSLIASPEGEIDEEERAALFPRFSQLLQEGEDSLASDSTLVQTPINQQQATHRSTGLPPPLAASVSQRDSHANQPDHSIMNLKEQDLVGSMQSPPNKAHFDSKLRTAADLTTLSPAFGVPEDAQQTQLKTEYLKSEQSEEGISHNLADRKKHLSGGVNGQTIHEKRCADFQNCSDRKRMPSGCNSGQTIQQHPRTQAGDIHQTPCIKASPPEVSDSSRDQHQLNNRVVFFGNSVNLQFGNKQPSPRTDLCHAARSQGSSEAASANSRTMRSDPDTEKANTTQASSDVEETEWNHDSQKANTSSTSGKASVNSDLTDDNNGNPSTIAVYRRSQSQNCPSSSESPHKPPPRSISEEKPQKADRPVAKVKPMPASDNSVNQPPEEGILGDTVFLPQPLVCGPSTSNNTANILSSSTEESDHENMEMNGESTSTLEEDVGAENTGV